MSLEWMLQKGFPLEHIRASQRSCSGHSVFTNCTGTKTQTQHGYPIPNTDGNRVSGRRFDPLLSNAWNGPVNPQTLTRYNTITSVSNTLYSTVFTPSELEVMSSTIAIFVDGACRNNGKDNALAGFGVSLGAGSIYNRNGVIENSYRQTNQVAEIIAVMKGLEVAEEVRRTIALLEVVIVLDSEYVVRCICDYIQRWLANGFKTSQKNPVQNAELFRVLNAKIDNLNDQGLQVKFWRVSRDMNKHADQLANEALDQELNFIARRDDALTGDIFTGATQNEIYSRIIYSYRLRVADEHTYYHGLYALDDRVRDFDDFMNKAEIAKVFPPWWGKVHRDACSELADADGRNDMHRWLDTEGDIDKHYSDGTMVIRFRAFTRRVKWIDYTYIT